MKGKAFIPTLGEYWVAQHQHVVWVTKLMVTKYPMDVNIEMFCLCELARLDSLVSLFILYIYVFVFSVYRYCD